MPRGQLDGPGLAKIAVLEDALATLQRIHGLVEKMALSARTGQDSAPIVQSMRRAAAPLVGQLKAQFGAASDVAAHMVLISSRGGMNEKARLRTLREDVGSLRAQLDAAATRVRAQHTVEEEETNDSV